MGTRGTLALGAALGVAAVVVACSSFGSDEGRVTADDGSAPLSPARDADAEGSRRDAASEGSADGGAPLLTRSWSFTDLDALSGFGFHNKSGNATSMRVTDQYASAPASFWSKIDPPSTPATQSADRYGFLPYGEAGSPLGRFRVELYARVDCGLGPDLFPSLVELFCDSAPRSPALTLNYGTTKSELLVQGYYKPTPDAAGAMTFQRGFPAPPALTWHKYVVDLVFAAGNASISFEVDDSGATVLTPLAAADLGCPGSKLALQFGVSQFFRDGGSGSCAVHYDDVALTYPAP